WGRFKGKTVARCQGPVIGKRLEGLGRLVKRPPNPSSLFCQRTTGTGYRFENWNALRAPLRPYFLRSFMRPSRVKYPESRSFLAMALTVSLPSSLPPLGRPNIDFKARAIPWHAAPACPVIPPPLTVMYTSSL